VQTLRDVQNGFAKAVFDIRQPPPKELALSRSGATPVRRFTVYRNNVIMSLTEVLAAYFPVVQRLLGQAFFQATVREFIISHPPSSAILSRYGADLPGFLADFEPVADLPYLPDVARLEWLQQRAYHAADAVALDADRLSQVDAGAVANMRLAFHPAAFVLASCFPVFSIWRTNTFDDEVVAVTPDTGGQAVLIVRPSLDVQTLLLPRGADVFIAALILGATVAEAFERTHAAEPDFDLSATLSALIELGALVDFDLEPAASAPGATPPTGAPT